MKRYENAKWDDVPIHIQQTFESMLTGGKGIYLHGEVGTGKTHIAYAMKKHYDQPGENTPNGWRSGRSLLLWNVVDLMHEIRSDFDRSWEAKRQADNELMNYRGVLILDDLGAEKATEFVAETLYRIINHRYVNMLPTVFTSNCTLQELAEKIGDRSASRITEMCDTYELTGADRRIKI